MEIVIGYIMDLRKIVGSRPLIMAGACVILVNSNNENTIEASLAWRKDNNSEILDKFLKLYFEFNTND
ncbi:hypothetical protein B1B04_09720 [Lysinibacillus sp. KCTC 33748]|nr:MULTISPECIES: hypothetical protein [unclassified Lysinibacillus]OXS74383.1 hypothetical protein B1B04_09720 [Lysinibacillus sp. KCTC 33748]SKB65746.1 hypothetical protein SAMN06295926_105127 [Lysinibacillus sp. AC-3]